MSEMTPREEQESDDKLLDLQIDAHLEAERVSMRVDAVVSELLREMAPCQSGPCADCGGSGIDPSMLDEGMNGQFLVYVARIGKKQATPPTTEVTGVPF
jgi:hypothetical protein